MPSIQLELRPRRPEIAWSPHNLGERSFLRRTVLPREGRPHPGGGGHAPAVPAAQADMVAIGHGEAQQDQQAEKPE